MNRIACFARLKRDDLEKLISEFFGTFVLVLAGTGSIIFDDVIGGGLSNLGIGLAFGLSVMLMILAFGNISGAHINPAVTLGFWVAGRLNSRYVFPYIFSQCMGAVAASLMLRLLFDDHPTLGATLPSGPAYESFILEALMTFILMFVILKVSTGAKEVGFMIAATVGAVVGLEAFWGGPISGASMNPARSLAPALVAVRLDYLWIYLIAPFAGAYFAVVACRYTQGRECCVKPQAKAQINLEGNG